MSYHKIISTSQGHIHKYENLKKKIYNCNANIYFNPKSLVNHIIPNYDKNSKDFPSFQIYTT